MCSAQERQPPIRSFALITSMAVTLANFRGPLIRDLIARGIHVYALAPDFDDRVRAAVRDLGAEAIDISLDRTGMNPWRDIRDAVRLCTQLRSLRVDAVLCYFIKPVIYGSLASWVAGVPRRYSLVAGLGYVFTDNGSHNTIRRRILRRIVTMLYRLAFSVSHRVFFQNGDDVAYFSKGRHTMGGRSVRLNGTGVDLEKLKIARPFAHPVTFLLMARLLREKGVCEFAAAARRVKVSYPDARFILLGALDPNPGALPRGQVDEWVREGILEWPGHVIDVGPWIAQTSVYVLPSYREGMPRSTQEAMAMGRPVITTDTPGCRETVEHGVSGYIVPVRDVEALREAMERFITEPGAIERMGKESRRLAEERFDVRSINAVMLREMGID